MGIHGHVNAGNRVTGNDSPEGLIGQLALAAPKGAS
jgi:hypothetical protein